MEARGATTPAFPVKSRKGKIEFTGKLAIGAPGVHPKDPPMSRKMRVFGTLRSSNFPTEVPGHKTSLRPKAVPLARKMEKESVEFSEKRIRNQRKDNIVVLQTLVTSSPGNTAMAQVANPKPKLTSHPFSLAPETSTWKTGHIDPKLEKSVCFPEKSRSNLKEDNIVVPHTPVASSPGCTVKNRVSDLNPKPEKSVCLPMNSREDDMAVLPTPVASYATDTPPSVARSATEKPSSDEKSGDLGLMLKKKKKSVCFQEKSPRLPRMDDTLVPRTPMVPPPGGAVKPMRSGTPYHTAETSRSRRLDTLETASYWLTQIKVAESAIKHFVSATFFCLAFESKAEPVRNLRVELRRYLARHAHLSEHPEWKDVSRRYGLVKDGGGPGSDCSVTRDIGLIKLSGNICNRQGDSREDIGEESREQLAASPPNVSGGGPDIVEPVT